MAPPRAQTLGGAKFLTVFHGLGILYSPPVPGKQGLPGLEKGSAEALALLPGGVSGKAHPNGAVDDSVGKPNGLQYMAPAAPLAGGALGHIDPLCLQIVHQHLAPVAGEGEGQDMRRPASQDGQIRDGGGESFDAVPAQGGHLFRRLRQRLLRQTAGLAEGGDLGQRLRAGAQAVLLPTSGGSFSPGRMYRAPIPLGAWIL